MKYIGCLLLFLLVSFYAKSTIRLPDVIGNDMVLQQQSDVKLWGWGAPGEQISVTTSWDQKTYPAVTTDGNADWQLVIHTPAAGGPYQLILKGANTITLTNVMIGEVWICSGQSNMEMSGNWGLKEIRQELPLAANPGIRFFRIAKATAATPQKKGEAHWETCDSNSLKAFSAVAYFFGKQLNKELQVPVGLIEAAWGGTSAEVWTPEAVITGDPFLKAAAVKIEVNGQCPNLPGYAYNGMIAPISNFSVAGTIWYQGENNTVNAYAYRRLFTAMIDAWRKTWHNNMPFYFVQIAPYKYTRENTGALLREAQAESASYPHTGMVVTADLTSDVHNVHPANKHDVGKRLANWALGDHYRLPGIIYKSPVIKAWHIQKDKIVLEIADAPDGLLIKGAQPCVLLIAGADRIFYPATALIKGNTIEVRSKKVPHPVAVRYGFSDTGIGTIFSVKGLPLAPFRTDKWPLPVIGR